LLFVFALLLLFISEESDSSSGFVTCVIRLFGGAPFGGEAMFTRCYQYMNRLDKLLSRKKHNGWLATTFPVVWHMNS